MIYKTIYGICECHARLTIHRNDFMQSFNSTKKDPNLGYWVSESYRDVINAFFILKSFLTVDVYINLLFFKILKLRELK